MEVAHLVFSQLSVLDPDDCLVEMYQITKKALRQRIPAVHFLSVDGHCNSDTRLLYKRRQSLCSLENYSYYAYVSLTLEIFNGLFVGMMFVLYLFVFTVRNINIECLSLRTGMG